MIGFYNYTVILTYAGTFFGFMGIICVLEGNLKEALICLMIAGFCDMFDGKIASTMKRTKQEKRFGIQIDSLSDLVCFGVLPALIVYRCSDKERIYVVACVIYLLCALIRLAWFNVDEEERQAREEHGRECYLGLPVTTSAVLLPLFMATAARLKLPSGDIAPLILFFITAAFISPFTLKKPGLLGKIILMLCGLTGLILVLTGGVV
ncbi:MAG: CDP-alcohol phosphatidyltransferase family protein [Oscillospiraceae bacterium]|nr:CDP-alcohol phosphatidyltransferase family protein [Oscillospiraceae bacterium]